MAITIEINGERYTRDDRGVWQGPRPGVRVTLGTFTAMVLAEHEVTLDYIPDPELDIANRAIAEFDPETGRLVNQTDPIQRPKFVTLDSGRRVEVYY